MASEAAPARARVLVIDDEEVVHVSLERMLGRMGYEVDAVLTAQQGLQRLAAARYDLIITDLMMPEMDGIALLEELGRRRERTPVLMITGYPTIRTALQALRLGATDYLAKPFTRAELQGPVSRALRRSAPEPGAAGGAERREEAPAANAAPTPPRVGELLALPQHAWARYRQDGTLDVGITGSFLHAVGAVATVELPGEADLVEQGYVAIKLRNEQGEEHGVLMPLSGQVLDVNEAAAAAPAALGPGTWLIRLVPNHLAEELALLVRDVEAAGGSGRGR